ncbi:anti-sigma B factor RsbW [Lederbergia wuyishanensis]|uniref:Serine-protein kinase RsbW n=1 Tax=Lederbergia wuyishanensis TaxID=1347903 RepID=A0ABU0D9Z5_9BACI|nr:anti-sigma B factor RsbW [Lederbergia wuyishanensis]MCJ8008514.1 anti-sigma B factor RsbW [Lederbergia wuyishanensis]MDQ0345257.1 serine/threonine-protein kinase RsbW [Lederbergia wuyishanensis]
MREAFDYIEMKIPAMPEYVGVIRLTLSGIASRMGFTYDLIDDLKIAVSEAITNAVQHAYKKDEGGEIVVGFGLYQDRLEVMVADSGKSFDLNKARDEIGPYHENSQVEFLREGGLGLYLIESLMDEVKILQNEGVTVFMTKYLEGEQVEGNVETIST